MNAQLRDKEIDGEEKTIPSTPITVYPPNAAGEQTTPPAAEALTEYEYQTIKAYLVSVSRIEREQGKALLLSLGSKKLAEYFEKERLCRKRRNFISVAALSILMVVSLAVSVRFRFSFNIYFAIVPAMAATAAFSKSYLRAVEVLTEEDTLDGLNELIYTLQAKDSMVQNKVIVALTKRLGTLTEQDHNRINAEARSVLNKWLLRRFRNIRTDDDRADELDVAILKVLPQIGSYENIEAVESLAGRRFNTNRDTSEAAARCLPLLKEAVERRRSGEQLLRAAAPSSSGDDLLRSTSAPKSDVEAEELLRPLQ
jgi:hypothetical protein